MPMSGKLPISTPPGEILIADTDQRMTTVYDVLDNCVGLDTHKKVAEHTIATRLRFDGTVVAAAAWNILSGSRQLASDPNDPNTAQFIVVFDEAWSYIKSQLAQA